MKSESGADNERLVVEENSQGDTVSVERGLFFESRNKINRLIKQLAVIGLLTQTEIAQSAEFNLAYPVPPSEAIEISTPEEKEQLLYLKNLFGPNAVAAIHHNQEGELIGSPEPMVYNFDRQHLSPEELRLIFVSSYPKNWIRGEVERVSFSSDTVKRSPEYGINRPLLGQAKTGGRRNLTDVTLFKKMIGTVEYLSEVYAHETGHANDWANDNTLSYQERLELFSAVATRFFYGHDCYPSSYVDEIKNDDPIQKRNLQITEYWAELCEAYFTRPNDLRRYPEDFALVDNWVKKQDPDYDPDQSERARQEAIFQYHLRFFNAQDRQTMLQYRQQWLDQARSKVDLPELTQSILTHPLFEAAPGLDEKSGITKEERLVLARNMYLWVKFQIKHESSLPAGTPSAKK